MANRNGLGPNNEGKMTGRALGNCLGVDKESRNFGFGRRQGRGRGFKNGMMENGRRGRRFFHNTDTNTDNKGD